MKTLFLATLDFIRRLSAAVPVLAVAALLSVAGSCSTTRVLQDGEYRLAKTEVHVSNDKKFNTGKIDPYIKQKPNSNLIFGGFPGAEFVLFYVIMDFF